MGLNKLLEEASEVYNKNFGVEVFFERSIFTNWTCSIADCKYCYLSTKPKNNPLMQTKAVRSTESILAETLICKLMEWDIGYITGGLRVESTEKLILLLDNISKVYGRKIMMNYGPYSLKVIKKLKPHISGMGCAIESFDENLHNDICPSKPLKSLISFLENLQNEKMTKLITIILGFGETKDDVNRVIDNIKKFNIEKVQLCFLKPQEGTLFAKVPSPNIEYMAYWAAKIRIECPTVIIKVALVKDRIKDFSTLLKAGVNGFSRFLVWNDFGTKLAYDLQQECVIAKRKIKGNFIQVPFFNIEEEVKKLNLPEEMKKKILPKAKQYYQRLLEKQQNHEKSAESVLPRPKGGGVNEHFLK